MEMTATGIANFDSVSARLLRWMVRKHSCLTSPRRLARPRTSPFHGGNTGSNPVGDAKPFNQFHEFLPNSGVQRRYKFIAS